MNTEQSLQMLRELRDIQNQSLIEREGLNFNSKPRIYLTSKHIPPYQCNSDYAQLSGPLRVIYEQILESGKDYSQIIGLERKGYLPGLVVSKLLNIPFTSFRMQSYPRQVGEPLTKEQQKLLTPFCEENFSGILLFNDFPNSLENALIVDDVVVTGTHIKLLKEMFKQEFDLAVIENCKESSYCKNTYKPRYCAVINEYGFGEPNFLSVITDFEKALAGYFADKIISLIRSNKEQWIAEADPFESFGYTPYIVKKEFNKCKEYFESLGLKQAEQPKPKAFYHFDSKEIIKL